MCLSLIYKTPSYANKRIKHSYTASSSTTSISARLLLYSVDLICSPKTTILFLCVIKGKSMSSCI
jgi:hypothetical protein